MDTALKSTPSTHTTDAEADPGPDPFQPVANTHCPYICSRHRGSQVWRLTSRRSQAPRPVGDSPLSCTCAHSHTREDGAPPRGWTWTQVEVYRTQDKLPLACHAKRHLTVALSTRLRDVTHAHIHSHPRTIQAVPVHAMCRTHRTHSWSVPQPTGSCQSVAHHIVDSGPRSHRSAAPRNRVLRIQLLRYPVPQEILSYPQA